MNLLLSRSIRSNNIDSPRVLAYFLTLSSCAEQKPYLYPKNSNIKNNIM